MPTQEPPNTSASPAPRMSAWRTAFLSLTALVGRALRQLGKPGKWLEGWALKRLGVWEDGDADH